MRLWISRLNPSASSLLSPGDLPWEGLMCYRRSLAHENAEIDTRSSSRKGTKFLKNLKGQTGGQQKLEEGIAIWVSLFFAYKWMASRKGFSSWLKVMLGMSGLGKTFLFWILYSDKTVVIGVNLNFLEGMLSSRGSYVVVPSERTIKAY